jgi:hypothetical protein
MTIDLNWQLIGGSLLLCLAPAYYVWQRWQSRVIEPRDKESLPPESRSSDQKPPDGFAEHVAIVVAAAPTATPEVVLSYLRAGLTEADTLRAEVKRMGGAI